MDISSISQDHDIQHDINFKGVYMCKHFEYQHFDGNNFRP